MKVKLAFYPSRFRAPQVCGRCPENPSQGYDKIKVMEFADRSGERWNTWAFKFPYRYSCLEDLKQRKNGILKKKLIFLMEV